jgi:pyruvate/2-oxoglutarate/acetoin dehydrogenase E1 component
MPRLAGLAYASRLYRELPGLKDRTRFSNGGNEVAFGTIGNASCAEGLFWETINAVGVLRSPLVMSIWDDEYGISVHNAHQLTKEDLSELLSGFARRTDDGDGFDLYRVKGWDYLALCEAYVQAADKARRHHVPAILHVIELTQPQGHSTSGSHERYKSEERLAWEREHDCLKKMREWLIAEGYAAPEQLDELERDALADVREQRRRAWEAFQEPILRELAAVAELCGDLAAASRHGDAVREVVAELEKVRRIGSPLRRDLMSAVHRVLLATRDGDLPGRRRLIAWREAQDEAGARRYGAHLYSETAPATAVPAVAPVYGESAETLHGFEILNRCFDAALERYPELIAFGEDLGRLGDVNQGFAGLQEKYGELRVSDVGIRECTILGQAIGMAMRGLRPIAEVQYLDYLLYALQTMSDDLATVQWRSAGRQKAPVIVRTRGHRFEGVWHSGSPMAGILNLVRGIYVCVPRDMTQAAGFYNTMLRSEDSALIVEVLNGYRRKEKLPDNVGEMTVPLGVPEILRPGNDVTLVTYGACCPIALAAAEQLAEVGADVEVIDVRTLLPFDRPGLIGQSLRRTGRVVFLDEDVPGGATAYMLQQVVEGQQGYAWLDSQPRTIPAAAHRPAYASDGDYWSKPNVETVFRAVYELLHEAEPSRYPIFYR